MRPTRRSFIKTVAVGILGNGLISSLTLKVFAKAKDDNGIEIEEGFKVFNQETQQNMEALAETLVPGSKKIGIKQIFINYISREPGQAGFFDAGLWNLDTISKTKFHKPYYKLTNMKQQKKVIDHISGANSMFFRRFRRKIIELYYSNPAVWKRLSYSGPPQPRGFMDYSLPPKV